MKPWCGLHGWLPNLAGCWRGSRCGRLVTISRLPVHILKPAWRRLWLEFRWFQHSLGQTDRRGRVSSNTTDERYSHIPESITPITADFNYTNAIPHVWQSVVKKPRERAARFWISYGRNQSPVSHASNGCEGRPVRNENESPPAAGSMGSTVGNDCLLGSWKFMAFL